MATVAPLSTRELEAYREYVIGRSFWRQRTEDGLRTAVEHFNLSTHLNPLFARAFSGLADCYVLYDQFAVRGLDRMAAWALAQRSASEALALDSSLAEAYASLGEVAYYTEWNWAKAESLFIQAIEHDPYYATAHQWYAELLVVTGRADSAIAEGERAALYDPVTGVVNHAKAVALLAARRYPEAIAQYQRVLRLDPSLFYAHLGLTWAYIAQGSLDSALPHMLKLAQDRQDSTLTREWVRAAVDSSHRLSAQRTLARWRSRVATWHPEIQASVYASIADTANALAVLERSVIEKRLPPGVEVIPLYDPIRAHPGFRAVLQKMGLPAT